MESPDAMVEKRGFVFGIRESIQSIHREGHSAHVGIVLLERMGGREGVKACSGTAFSR